MNSEMLRKVAAKLRSIKDEEYDQDVWATKLYDAPAGTCGTAACIGGWTAYLDGWELHPSGTASKGDRYRTIASIADDLLDLNGMKGETCLLDACGEGWPEPYRTRFRSALENGESGRIVAAELLEALADGTVEFEPGR